jgi:outer membrane protein OmpA-like peptidoglycan-associated protein
VLVARPVLGSLPCSMKSAGKFLICVAMLPASGRALNSTAQGLRPDQQLQRGIREVPFVKQSLLFAPDSAELSEESKTLIKRVASWLGEHPEIRVLIVGFCDPVGSETCTHDLAARRGSVVARVLMGNGVAPSQIAGTKGWEKADPVCTAITPACEAMNRRGRICVADPAPGSTH